MSVVCPSVRPRRKEMCIDRLFYPVINMTLPDEKEGYIHRIGRVGRAER